MLVFSDVGVRWIGQWTKRPELVGQGGGGDHSLCQPKEIKMPEQE